MTSNNVYNISNKILYFVTCYRRTSKGREGGEFCSKLSEKLCFEAHGKDELGKITMTTRLREVPHAIGRV